MENLKLSGVVNNYSFMIQLTGLWPKRQSSLLYKIYGYISMISVIIFGVTILIRSLTNLSDIEELLYGISGSSAAFQCILKYSVVHSKQSDFLQVFLNLDDPTFISNRKIRKYNDCIESKIRMSDRLRNLLIGSTMGTLVLVALGPIFSKKSERVLPLPFPIDVNKEPVAIYVGIWIFQAVTSTIISWSVCCLDCLNYTLLWIAVGQLEILQEKIVASTKFFYSKSGRTGRRLNNALKDCVAHHVAIERFMRSVENAFNLIYLVQVVASLIPICLMGFYLVLVPIISVQFGRCFCFFAAVILELALTCIPGNEMSLQSKKVMDACYTMDWYRCSPAIRRTLFLIMERSKKPFFTTAGKFINLSLDSLFAVLKSAFSYFMVLHRLYADK